MEIDKVLKAGVAKIHGAEESRKPWAVKRLAWELQRIRDIDNGLPRELLEEIAVRYEPHFTATLVASVENHQPREFTERALGEISLAANAEVAKACQEYFDQKQPGYFVGRAKAQLEKFLWRTRERHCIAQIIKPLLPVEIVDIGWQEIKLSNGKTITRRDLLEIDRPVGVNADFETFERNFVNDGMIAREIQRRKLAAAKAAESFVGGSPGPWRHR